MPSLSKSPVGNSPGSKKILEAEEETPFASDELLATEEETLFASDELLVTAEETLFESDELLVTEEETPFAGDELLKTDELNALLPGTSPGSVGGAEFARDDSTKLAFCFGKPPSPPQADKPKTDTINEKNTILFITATMLIK